MPLQPMYLFGNPAGFYEAGRRILSLHHWKSWHNVDIMAQGLVKFVCGDLCPLKRWRFRNRTVMTNGFSVVTYMGDTEPDLNKMEMTFVTEAGREERNRSSTWEELGHSLAPVRPELQEGKEKVSYRL